MGKKPNKGRLSRLFKRAALSALILAGGYKLAEPDKEFDATLGYEPNAVQQEFVKLAAQNYHYIAFGDTDHRKPDIHLFAFSDKTMSALEEAGKKNFFLEAGPAEQVYFDSFYAGTKDSTFYRGSFRYADGNMWLWDEVKDRLSDRFESAASHYNIHFIAADQRHGNEDPRQNMGTGDKILTHIFLTAPLVLYDKIYGCVDTPAFLPSIVLAVTGTMDRFMDAITDDRPTAEYMNSFSEPAAILYGAGHFQGSAGAQSMRQLLVADGNSLVVIEIYRDAEQKKEAEQMRRSMIERGETYMRPDAEIYIVPPADMPDGINIINPDLRDEYEDALKHIHDRLPAAPEAGTNSMQGPLPSPHAPA